MAEYTESFARFILECRASYDDLCARIESGDVPAGRSAKITIEVPPEAVDRIRFERIVIAGARNG